ncbi:MAG: prepilin-type N-terminal cleavage/methylation domain-containing protein [Candidatus Omnitrophota bacterium]|nr:prepilin-type N-terminal cleavage/methylation domain-containing protein [Candidatus Omnitrophota bacterium]
MKRIQNDGFTLIELTLVTLLVLIIAGLSTPLFKKTLSDLSARNTSFTICKLINYAQEMAVLERNNYKVAFDLKKGRYQLLTLSASTKPPAYIKTTGRFGKLFALPQGLRFAGEKSGVVFYPDGHCDEIVVNVLAGAGGYSIMVKGFGNAVEIKEAKVEQ